jgi:hypothetical protein
MNKRCNEEQDKACLSLDGWCFNRIAVWHLMCALTVLLYFPSLTNRQDKDNQNRGKTSPVLLEKVE